MRAGFKLTLMAVPVLLILLGVIGVVISIITSSITRIHGATTFTARGGVEIEGVALFVAGGLLLGAATSLRLKIIRSAERETSLGFSRNANLHEPQNIRDVHASGGGI